MAYDALRAVGVKAEDSGTARSAVPAKRNACAVELTITHEAIERSAGLSAVARSEHCARARITTVDLIGFGGHLPKGGYDVRNGRNTRPTTASAIHG
jgi:hypothetical protein